MAGTAATYSEAKSRLGGIIDDGGGNDVRGSRQAWNQPLVVGTAPKFQAARSRPEEVPVGGGDGSDMLGSQ